MQNRGSFARDHASADHILSFFRKLRLDWLLRHFPPRLVRSVYVFVNGFITIGVLALLALASRNPFVFPSLGPHLFGWVGTFILGIETGMFAEHLLNNRLQMRRLGATEEFVTLTKQTKISLCEQVRVN